MITPDQSIPALIAAYNEATGGCARACIYERDAYEFLKAGFSQEDLVTVVKHIQRENKKRPDCQHSLALGKMLTDLIRFNDLLSAANAKPKQTTPKQQVVREFRRYSEEETKTVFRNVGEILKSQMQ